MGWGALIMIIYVVTTESTDYFTDDIYFTHSDEQSALKKATEIASAGGSYLNTHKLNSIYKIILDRKKVVEQEIELEDGEFKLKEKVVK